MKCEQSQHFLRSSNIIRRHNNFDLKLKLDGTRVKFGCEMRCEAGSNIDEREIENS